MKQIQPFQKHWLQITSIVVCRLKAMRRCVLLSGVPDYFGRNEISSGGDLSDYSSASLY